MTPIETTVHKMLSEVTGLNVYLIYAPNNAAFQRGYMTFHKTSSRPVVKYFEGARLEDALFTLEYSAPDPLMLVDDHDWIVKLSGYRDREGDIINIQIETGMDYRDPDTKWYTREYSMIVTFKRPAR